jgi:signal transduction histidine kinase
MAGLSMTSRDERVRTRWSALAYACIASALVLIVLMGAWGAYRDITANNLSHLRSAVSRLDVEATRRAGHIESALEHIGAESHAGDLSGDPWFQRYWREIEPLKDHQLYAAIVAPDGTVVIHTDSQAVGQKLGRRWYDRVVSGVGDDVVETNDAVLAGGRPSFDIRIPLSVSGREVGEYHEGLSKDWFEAQMAAERQGIVARWSIVVGANLVAVILAILALYYLANHSMALRRAVGKAHLQRVTEVGQLAAGLAHEIRNPLHAIRLNLHTLRRVAEGNLGLSDSEVSSLVSESEREIERVDQLLRELLGFAKPDEARNQRIDVCEHVRATLSFLKQELERGRIDVLAEFPPHPVMVYIDPNRLRQVVLNLLLNASEVMDQGGTLRVLVRETREQAEVTVSDTGPGVPEKDRRRVFEPFYTTKEGGTGFGLALAKRYVTEAEGAIACVSNGQRGATFEIRLPISRGASTKE